MKKFVSCILLLASLNCSSASATDPKEIGIVLMHGWGLRKGNVAGQIDPHVPNVPLANALKREGYLVIQEELPWGPNRLIDGTVDVALKEIDSQVDRLKAQGAKKIIVAGHSMGTPMALAYAARRDGLAGVIGLAPGHHPELMPAMYPDFFPKQLTNAKEAVAAGKGDERTAFQAAQCCTFYQTFWTTPRIYLDYFDSEGSGTMAGNAALVKEGIPVLMVYGEKDVIFKLLSDAKESYSDYVPSRLKPNPLHKRIIIDSDHRSVPERASSQVIEWLKTLP